MTQGHEQTPKGESTTGPGLSRRGFLQGAGAAALAVGFGPGAHAETPLTPGTLPETLHVLGATMELLLDSHATGGRLAVLVETTPPGGGPPLHSHANEEEYFYVIDGDFEFTLADETLRPKPGDFLTIPRGVPHRFENVGDVPGHLHITLSPAGFEEFFRAVSALIADGPPDPEELGRLGAAHGLTWHTR